MNPQKEGIPMTRDELQAYINTQFSSIETDYPWVTLPNYMVYRHQSNRKWFALVMNISSDKLGLSSTAMLDVLNVKCDPTMIGSFTKEPGIYRAYHMSKAHWLTIALNGTASDQTIKMLLDMSFRLTAK